MRRAGRRSAWDDPAREGLALGTVRRTAALLLRLAFRIEIRGAEHVPRSGPVLVAGNHTGWLDGPLVMILLGRPSQFLVKSELLQGPFRRVLAFARQIPIRRGMPDRTNLERALAVLAGGGVLGMFPEGTRGEGRLDTIQHGIGYLALRAGCPIVPVVCLGTAAALPRGARKPRFGTRIEIVFGPPFEIEVHGDPYARSTVAAAAEQVRARLLEHLNAVSPQP